MITKTIHHGRQFDLTVPSGWIVLSGYAGSVVTLAMSSAKGRDRFVPNVNVVWHANGRDLGPRELLDEAIKSLGQLLEDFVLIERSGEDQGLLFIYRRDALGLRTEQRYVLGHDEYFVITATTTTAGFAPCSGDIKTIINSFVLDEAAPVSPARLGASAW